MYRQTSFYNNDNNKVTKAVNPSQSMYDMHTENGWVAVAIGTVM